MKKKTQLQKADSSNLALDLNDDNYILQKGIEKLTEESGAFDFLLNDEDLYTLDDIKEKYK